MIPPAQVSGMLGTTKNKGMVSTAKQLPSKATEGKACTYVGKDNSATVVWYKFPTSAAARDYLKSVRDSFEKQSYKTVTEKFGDLTRIFVQQRNARCQEKYLAQGQCELHPQ